MAPAGKDELVIVRAEELIVMDNAIITEADVLSVNFRVKLEEPVAVGVPVTFPAMRSKPGGNAPLTKDHTYGGDPPAALRA